MSVKRILERVKQNKPLRRFHLEPAVKDTPWTLFRVQGSTGKLKAAYNLRTGDKFQAKRWREVAAYIVAKSVENKDNQTAGQVLEVLL